MERALRRDSTLVFAGIAVITLLSWVYLARMATAMNAAAADNAMHAAMGMADMAAWGAAEFVMLFLMWAVMMVAMMLPSATPIILLVVGTYRRRTASSPLLTLAFVSGYVIAWSGFSVAAAALQLMLHRAALLSAEMASSSASAGAAVLLLAGIYQWLPLKAACLTHCRSPLAFLTEYWREGTAGALGMGVRHGLFCVGCCWALMLLLFIVGVMNLFAVAAIAVFVLVEKIAPQGRLVSRLGGVVFASWAVWLFAQ